MLSIHTWLFSAISASICRVTCFRLPVRDESSLDFIALRCGDVVQLRATGSLKSKSRKNISSLGWDGLVPKILLMVGRIRGRSMHAGFCAWCSSPNKSCLPIASRNGIIILKEIYHIVVFIVVNFNAHGEKEQPQGGKGVCGPKGTYGKE